MRVSKVVGYILLIVGISIYLYKNLTIRNNMVLENNMIEYTLANQISYKYVDNKDKELYNMLLVIPQINLRKGIYEKDDLRNNIDTTVMIHDTSNYPDTNNGNVILVAHSGTGDKAYFKDLNKLNTDSLIELYYEHTKYIYKIDNIYNVNKVGKININRDNSKNTISLITCNQIDKSKQTVYIGYLIDTIKY